MTIARETFNHAREMVLRSMAGLCEADAEDGEFNPIGKRCEFCLHATADNGCRLRLIAKGEAWP